MLFCWTFYSSKNPEKICHCFHKNIMQHNCYHAEHQISILEWFLKDHVTLKTKVMATENSSFHHRNKLHFKIYSNRKHLYSIVIIFHLISFFPLHFQSNKYSLLSKTNCSLYYRLQSKNQQLEKSKSSFDLLCSFFILHQLSLSFSLSIWYSETQTQYLYVSTHHKLCTWPYWPDLLNPLP